MEAAMFRTVMCPRPSVKTLVWILLSLLCGQSFADTASTAPYTVQPQLNWVAGPATVEIAGVADFQIPEGYRFLDVKGARALLERRGQLAVATPDLAGLVEPASGAGEVVLAYSEIGYVKMLSKGINAESVLEDVRGRMVLQNNRSE